jgi:hypothetical protein
MVKQNKCRLCGFVSPNPYQAAKHRRDNHPNEYRGGDKKTTSPNNLSAFDKLLDLKQKAKEVIKELEVERDTLHARILKIDDTIAKFNRGESIIRVKKPTSLNLRVHKKQCTSVAFALKTLNKLLVGHYQ